jgi:light-harvesting protein B-800-850 alpha chain
MNQGRIWCVVSPSVGLPLFLGSVAVMSFTVHFAVLNNTTWVKDFFQGAPMAKTSMEQKAAPLVDVAAAMKPAMATEVEHAATPVTGDSASLDVTVKTKTPTVESAAAAPG